MLNSGRGSQREPCRHLVVERSSWQSSLTLEFLLILFRNPAPVGLGNYMYINIPLFTGFHISQLVVWDFWTINCSPHENLFNLSMSARVAFLASNCWFRFGLQVDAANAWKAQKEMGEVTSDHTFKPKLRSELCCRFFGRGMEKKNHPKMIPKNVGYLLDWLRISLFLGVFFWWGWGEVEGWIYSVSMDRWSPYCCHIFNGICIRPFRKIRNYAGVTQAWGTLLCDTMFWKIMVTSSKDC